MATTTFTSPPLIDLPTRFCEEVVGVVHDDEYVHCLAPTVASVGWTNRTEGPYALCLPCADHYIRNRQAVCLGVSAALSPAHAAELQTRWTRRTS